MYVKLSTADVVSHSPMSVLIAWLCKHTTVWFCSNLETFSKVQFQTLIIYIVTCLSSS